jgi:Uma2 family endonuclease
MHRTHPQRQPGSPSGPFRADQLRDGDRYELSQGHPRYCAPAGPEHAIGNLTGAAVLGSDPAVEWAGIDAGFSPEPGMLRAPDVAVGAPPPSNRGWIEAAPPLALEYASRGQDEADLQTKIAELIGHGTRLVWVARLTGPRRVEVYEAGQPMRVAVPGDDLLAPGILHNPVPVEALFDRAAGARATLRNLLQRFGYADLEAVRAEGRDEGLKTGRDEGREEGHAAGLAQAVLNLLAGRGIHVDEDTRARVSACRDPGQLDRWLLAAATVERAAGIFDDDRGDDLGG